ncbi:hypothetical protein [Parenemella sanctibonifatiensis]|uniref:Uncharacterized protein n=1 Tax=Parenemella sanctibonifatiensis TaxID=2016505 RepID=A0A255EIK4_9ACTN|nr:hypothetical protein [Parenemella sanctibonifatiensis]OYN87963.1 hypothetical protein CGZ92_06815 [Parenemella sanctibonifatiensis]
MRVVEEFGLLASEMLSLWLRYFPQLGVWFCLGWTLNNLTLWWAGNLGGDLRWLAMMVFVIGVVGMVMGLVMMIHSIEPGLHTPAEILRRQGRGEPLTVPAGLVTSERAMDVATSALGPFLAVYAVWGLVEDQVSALFLTTSLHNRELDDRSIDLRDWQLYLVMAIGAWVLKRLLTWLSTKRPGPWFSLPALLAEGVMVFTSFLAIFRISSNVIDWLSGRRLGEAIDHAWRTLVDAIPDLHLPFDLTLPKVIEGAFSWLWSDFLPAMWQGLMLPLMWLALTAVVFGWREIRGRDLLEGTRFDLTNEAVAARAERLAPLVRGPLGQVLDALTADLKDKYIPVVRALRLIARSGLPFIGAYLVLATLIAVAGDLFSVLQLQLIGPQSAPVALAWIPLLDLIQGLLFTSLSIALYAAAFDRGIADVTGADWRRRRIQRATRIGAPN